MPSQRADCTTPSMSLGDAPFHQQKFGLAHVDLGHTVADEAIAHTAHDRYLAHPDGKRARGFDRI